MTWIKQGTWVPDGAPDSLVLRPDIEPFVYFARHRYWSLVRDEVAVENPSHLVLIKGLFAPMYGLRISGYEIRLYDELPPEQLSQWEDMIRCRLVPGSAS